MYIFLAMSRNVAYLSDMSVKKKSAGKPSKKKVGKYDITVSGIKMSFEDAIKIVTAVDIHKSSGKNKSTS